MSSVKQPPGSGSVEKRVWGYLAEFELVDEFLAAVAVVRDAGYTRWDTHSPFVLHGLDPAMGIKKTILPYVVFLAGLTGAAFGILLQWYTNAFDYPFLISGKPIFSLPANIPVAFEMTILFAAFGALVGMLALNGLPNHYHPLFHNKRFKRATDDRFFISIEKADPLFDENTTRELLETISKRAVEVIEEEE